LLVHHQGRAPLIEENNVFFWTTCASSFFKIKEYFLYDVKFKGEYIYKGDGEGQMKNRVD